MHGAPQPSTPHSDIETTPYHGIQAYRTLVGSLPCIARMLRPDITYAVRSTSRTAVGNWEDAIHLVRYLFGTQNEGITIVGVGLIIV